MVASYAVRITLPFSDVSGIVRAWALKADKLLCYEHVGTVTEKQHVHLLMMRVACDPERLKQIAQSIQTCGKGNEFWSFKTKTKGHGPIDEVTARRYIIYMAKGVHLPKYNKGYEDDFLETVKKEWEEKPEVESPDSVIFRSFMDHVYQLGRDEPDEHPFRAGTYLWEQDKGKELATVVRSWAFRCNNQIWNVRTASMAKMVFLTYCMRYQIDIPQDVKLW